MNHDENPEAAAPTPLGALPSVDTQGDDPMTPEQAAILRDLCEQTGAEMDGALTRQQAEERIEALREQADRS